MALLVRVSVSPPCVTIGRRLLYAQWVEFYALLAVQHAEDPAALVTVERVHQSTGWSLKKPDSVGKEIARHLALLRGDGLEHVVFSPPQGKTKAWRLALARTQVALEPSLAAVKAWLAARTRVEGGQLVWSREMVRLVQAAVLLRKGRASEAQQVLGPRPDLHDPTLTAWRALEEGRAVYLADEESQLEKLDALLETWARSSEPAGRAVSARLRSYQVMRDRFGDATSIRATLTKMIADLELAGDVGSLGVMLNVLGVLERRAGEPARAFEHLSRAAGLLGILGDYHALQAALYNAAQAYRSTLKREGRGPDELAFSLLELSLLVCREFHVGGDSALAEITRADWLLDAGRLVEAEAQLAEASPILESSEVSYDQAYFLQVRARASQASGAPPRAAVRDLKASIRIYGEVGDVRAARRATLILRRLSQGRS